MTDLHSPCMGCRFAKWTLEIEMRLGGWKYGQCEHPVAKTLRALPMVVKVDIPFTYSVTVDGITNDARMGLTCPTREPTPPEPPSGA